MAENIHDNEELTGWEDFLNGDRPQSDRVMSTAIALAATSNPIDQAAKEAIREVGIEKIVFPELIQEMINYQPPTQDFNRFGLCPNCQHNLDAGDIFENLCNLEVLTKQGDVGKIAKMYGWQESDKKHFSKVIDHTIGEETYHECPKCHHVFEKTTSKEYKSMFDLKLFKYNKEKRNMPEFNSGEAVDDEAPF